VSNPLGSPIDHVEVRQQQGMRPGGFGIFMTRQLVDEMIYNEKGNEVLLIKYLE
jgi:two-component system, OmpR family, response regulator